MADQLYIPRKDVDFFTITRLQKQLEEAGIETNAAHKIANAVADHTIANNRDRWLAIERWANRNVGPTTNTNYDCTVDALATSNNVSTFTFTDVASACTTMFALGFTTGLRIGMVPRWNSGTQIGIAAKDTVILSNLNTPHNVYISNINAGQVGGTNSAPPADQGDGCIWDMNGQAHNLTSSGLANLELRNITMINTGAARQNYLGNTYNGRVVAHGCNFEGNGANTTTAVLITSGTLLGTECTFRDANCTGTCWIENSYIFANVTATSQIWGTGTSGTWTTFLGCDWEPATGVANPFPFLLNAPTVIIQGGTFSFNNWRTASGATQRTQLRFSGSSQLIHVQVASGNLGNAPTQWADINVVTSPDTVYLSGNFGEITLPAPTNTGVRQGHSVTGTALTGTDITGPADINLTIGHQNQLAGNSITLRGSGCCGTIRLEGSGTLNAVGLNMVGCTDCNIQGSGNLAPGVAANGQKAFNIDVTSARNILDFAGASTWPVASVDAGAGDVIRQT